MLKALTVLLPIVAGILILGAISMGIFRVKIRPTNDSRIVTREIYWLSIAVVVCALFALAIFVANVMHWIIGLLFFCVGMILFILQGLDKASVSPPEIFLVTLLGRPTNMIKRQGIRFFPLRGVLFGGVKVKTEIVNEDIHTDDIDLPGVKFITGDNVQGAAILSISYKVMAPVQGEVAHNYDKEYVIPVRNFIDAGREEGVRDILDDKAISAFVDFMAQRPTWEDAKQLDNGIINSLVRAIAGGDGLERVPSSVQTALLLKYFKISSEEFNENEKKTYKDIYPDLTIEAAIARVIADDANGEELENMQCIIDARSEREQEKIPKDYAEFLKWFLIERNKKLQALQAGNGSVNVPSLGITLVKVNVGSRAFDPDVMAAVSQKAIEEAQRRSEGIQADARREQALKLYKSEGFKGTLDDAVELQLIDAGKLPGSKREKVVNVYEIDLKVDDETKSIIKEVGPALGPLAGAIAAKIVGTTAKSSRKKN